MTPFRSLRRCIAPLFPLAALWISMLPACEQVETAEPGDPYRAGMRTVAVSNHPLEVFAARIGGAHVAIDWRLPGDVDPAFWNPTADDIAAMQQADVILLNGATYEKWLPTASLPAARTVDTCAAVTDRLIETDGPVHAHGPDGEHSHAGIAFTTWLDPDLAIAQATAVRDALVKADPIHQADYDSRYGLLVREIQERFAGVEQAINTAPDTAVIFSHPVYQYLARRFGMNGRTVHWEPGAEPDMAQIAELDLLLAEFPATWFIWESEPLPESVALLKSKGLRSVVFAPCGNRPDEGDLFDAIAQGEAALRQVYGAD
jgi:zinc transport system substrate-binding protein